MRSTTEGRDIRSGRRGHGTAVCLLEGAALDDADLGQATLGVQVAGEGVESVVERLLGLGHLAAAEGDTAHRVAKRGLLKPRDPDTVYSWLDLYQASGAQGLIAHPQGGSRGRYL